MTDERLQILLFQIRDVAGEIASFVQGRTKENLETDLVRERGIAMSLMILGELVTRIGTRSPDFVSSHPDVPWAKIRGFRNVLAHNYFGLESGTIWEAATVSVPALLLSLSDALPPDPQSGS
ncbi:MAG: DUF86 domain-containing protein [Devosia sp.]|nr:DUF86 domain-containing protein [Devosia sp.]